MNVSFIANMDITQTCSKSHISSQPHHLKRLVTIATRVITGLDDPNYILVKDQDNIIFVILSIMYSLTAILEIISYNNIWIL